MGRAARLAWQEGPSGRTARLATVGIAVVLAATTSLGADRGRAARAADQDDADLHVFDREAVESIQLLTGPTDFILTDHPYVAALARRLVPPNLVDPSRGRTRAGALTDRDAIEAAERYGARLVLIWADRLRRLPGVPPWLEKNYVLGQAFGNRSVKNARGAKDRSIYLRRDADLAAARAGLEGALAVRETVDYAGQLRLLGATVSAERIEAEQQFTVTLGWLALAPMPTDYHLAIQLVDPNGEIQHEQEHDLEGSARGTSTWKPGRWLFRTFALQPDGTNPAGEYRLQLSVLDPKTGQALDPELAPGADRFRQEPRGVLTLAVVQVE